MFFLTFFGEFLILSFRTSIIFIQAVLRSITCAETMLVYSQPPMVGSWALRDIYIVLAVIEHVFTLLFHSLGWG